MPDQQLFVTDKTGHESHMIKKMRSKAGKAPLSAVAAAAAAVADRDTYYDDFIPKKILVQRQREAAERAAADAPGESVANFGNAARKAAEKAEAARVIKRKRPAPHQTDKVHDIWSEEVPVLNPVLSSGQTTFETSKVPRIYKNDRRPNAVHVLKVQQWIPPFLLTPDMPRPFCCNSLELHSRVFCMRCKTV
jgi:hypothetical protein